MRRRDVLRVLAALPAAVAGALAVKPKPVGASPVWTGKPIDAALIGQVTSLRTSGNATLGDSFTVSGMLKAVDARYIDINPANVHHTGPSLAGVNLMWDSQRGGFRPYEVLHSADRPLRWERHADGWRSIWTD